jgi:hypothetical protein
VVVRKCSLESLVSEVVIYEVEYLETWGKQFRNIAECIITDLATVKLEMCKIDIGSY